MISLFSHDLFTRFFYFQAILLHDSFLFLSFLAWFLFHMKRTHTCFMVKSIYHIWIYFLFLYLVYDLILSSFMIHLFPCHFSRHFFPMINLLSFYFFTSFVHMPFLHVSYFFSNVITLKNTRSQEYFHNIHNVKIVMDIMNWSFIILKLKWA